MEVKIIDSLHEDSPSRPHYCRTPSGSIQMIRLRGDLNCVTLAPSHRNNANSTPSSSILRSLCLHFCLRLPVEASHRLCTTHATAENPDLFRRDIPSCPRFFPSYLSGSEGPHTMTEVLSTTTLSYPLRWCHVPPRLMSFLPCSYTRRLRLHC